MYVRFNFFILVADPINTVGIHCCNDIYIWNQIDTITVVTC